MPEHLFSSFRDFISAAPGIPILPPTYVPPVSHPVVTFHDSLPVPNFHFKSVNIKEIKELLGQITPKYIPGFHMLQPKLLIRCANVIARPLKHIFNLSLTCGKVPSSFKQSMVISAQKGSPLVCQ